ncbi:hypothetical protein SAMN02787142_7511 [Burkholderia sp. WP9]|nr:hypothetical protein SAMN02787142_7511 [Burkholderia sp. WP9]
MRHDVLYDFQAPISTDLTAILNQVGDKQSSHLAFARPFIDGAIANERLLASSVLMLCARAIGVQDGRERCLYAFAAAMELMVLSLGAHARLSDATAGTPANPLLTLGTAAGVLLGDVLYTRAFQIVVKTGHAGGLAEIARATERMVAAAANDRVVPNESTPTQRGTASFRMEAYASCCRLAGVLNETVSPDRHAQLGRLAERLLGTRMIPMSGDENVETKETDLDLLHTCFRPSEFRDALSLLLSSLRSNPIAWRVGPFELA